MPVLIVDDQLPFRSIARMVVDLTPGFEAAAEADSGEAGVDAALQQRPGLVLMDINLPGINGIEATRRILARLPDTVVVLVSTYTAEDLPADAATCGAAQYVHKEDISPAVIEAVWKAARN